MTRILADLNNATVDGRIRARLKRADGPVDVGDEVTIVDSSDPDDKYQAAVVAIDESTGLVSLSLVQRSSGLILSPDVWGRAVFENNSSQSTHGFVATR